MTNVIYDHQIFSWQKYGGISRYFYELAKRVEASEGFSASIVAPLHVNRYLAQGGISVKGVRIAGIRRGRRLTDWINRRIERSWLKWSGPDIVHETYYSRTSSAPKKCPVVVTIHDMVHERMADHYHKNDETSEKKRAAIARADRIVCISESTRSDLIKFLNPDPSKIRTIHHGVAQAPAAAAEARVSIGASTERPFFLYVGLRGSYKNFDNLLRAYASRPALRAEFDLVAFGDDPFSREELATMRSLGLTSTQVRWSVGDDSLLGLMYAKAAAFVYPSLFEGFGIPPLEAMRYGCPVVCSSTSSIPEVVGEAGLYFDPTDVDSIADALDLVAGSPERRLDLAARGLERVKLFTWDRCAAQTMEVYRELAE